MIKLPFKNRNRKPKPPKRSLASQTKKVIIGNTIAAITLIVFLGGAITYEQYLRPLINGETVWVPDQNLDPNTLLTQKNTHEMRLDKSIVEEGAISDPTQIWGKRAAEQLNMNQQITPKDLEDNSLIPTGDQEIYPIQNGWIYAIGGGIRRGDLVSIWTYPKTQQGTPAPGPISNSSIQSLIAAKQPVLTDITVEYVRNGSNQEVTNATDPTQNGQNTQDGLSSRENGSTTPSNLELLLTPDQFALLTQLSLTNQFIFAYR